MFTHIVKKGETLYQISRDYRVPISSILSSNPQINPDMIIIGQRILIPSIPYSPSNPFRILINRQDHTLTLYKDNTVYKTYPIAVGKIASETPIGNYIIINKAPNPGGPFGAMWMSISKEHYGIHGTNNPSSIGKNVSLGCIRMYNKDVVELATIISIGTEVVIR
ncbi:L,D-transpeptidase [Bacillus coahuilensis m2-6]|uniref:L,D-transpeptidase n=1 Tax=Bacillus coahuilensis p1.1.43 TaxID=1150625 RepID=A0A147K944_9BACI|nr:L,D-transpeptidase family protein [Bacillus coahuilensis]KUP06818.1 L,D-transpeptidase [Bacillus coahuilensis p1.1.43]KUP08375.1 L,D-transpeptidase [Bacillus coahuilensis m2-6]